MNTTLTRNESSPKTITLADGWVWQVIPHDLVEKAYRHAEICILHDDESETVCNGEKIDSNLTYVSDTPVIEIKKAIISYWLIAE